MLRTAFALLSGVILLVLGFMFSVILFAMIAVLGLALWGYLSWKTRKLRRTMQEQASNDGHVIDGEAVVVEEYSVTTKNVLPGDPGQPPSTQTRENP
jgi:ABC-type bacteriocin/lantibiotic exporter with double-glycine peptidase domain